MTGSTLLVIVAICLIAPHLPKAVGLAIGVGILLGEIVQALL